MSVRVGAGGGPERSYGCSTILSFPIRQPLTRRASFEPPPTRRRVFLALQLSLLVLGVWSLPLASMARVSSCVLALGSVALTAIEFLCSSLISQSRLRYICATTPSRVQHYPRSKSSRTWRVESRFDIG
ncbi:uncharacterized protein B0H18DRAFT_1012308, partial [Fomitopsis serialis]|uniref:uncharacterized protein n=1 Tax=Fomitopsis serialis TaxID=139415 RepID=UPI0020080418